MATGKIESSRTPDNFGTLLRQHRLALGLTQDVLAERAGLSAHGVQKLERGATQPYRDTAERLSRALQLTEQDATRFKAAVRPIRRHANTALPAKHNLPRHNLPVPTTTFVPRSGELERVMQRLRVSRLLTITGAGGCGKTRLATEVAAQLVGDFADGTWLVDLAPLTDAALVPQTIATTLGLRETPDRSPLDGLTDYLRVRRALLLLDNCEHVIEAAAEVVDELLRACADLKIIATSRELLGVSGEASWRIGSLSIPSPDDAARRADDFAHVVVGSESGRLFADRAALVTPSFGITSRNAPAVAQICQRLDGIPLAIELAAARLMTLSVDQIAARLDQRFRLLTGGKRTAVRRQQTLEGTIDWSYDLLSEAEQKLFGQLAVFAGAWSLEAAEAVAGDSGSGDVDVLELLSQLVAKSMVVVEEPPDDTGEVRYRFLETIRQYAEQKLLEAGEAERARIRFRNWYTRLAEQGSEGMESSDQKEWLDRLELEYDNLRAALAWSASDPGGGQHLLRLAGSLGRFWQWRGSAREGIDWLEMALAGKQAPGLERALALHWRGLLDVVNGNEAAGRPFLEQCISEARTLGDNHLLSQALRHLAFALAEVGPSESAWQLLEEALAVSRAGRSQREIAWNLAMLGRRSALRGDLEAAEELLQEALLVGRSSGDVSPVMTSLLNLGVVYGKRGDFKRARRVLVESVDLCNEVNVSQMAAAALVPLGDICMAEHDWDSAERAYRTALEDAFRGTTHAMMASAGRRYAALCQARGDHVRAVRLLAACGSISRGWDSLIYFDPIASGEHILEVARTALGEEEFTRAVGAGQSCTLEEAIVDALRPETFC